MRSYGQGAIIIILFFFLQSSSQPTSAVIDGEAMGIIMSTVRSLSLNFIHLPIGFQSMRFYEVNRYLQEQIFCHVSLYKQSEMGGSAMRWMSIILMYEV